MVYHSKYETWYRKWGKNYFRYLLFQVLRVAIMLLVLITLRDIFKIIKSGAGIERFYQPVKFYILSIILLPFMVHYHRRWKLMRIKYYLAKPGNDVPASIYRSAEKLTAKYRRWKSRFITLVLLNAFIVSSLFTGFLYILLSAKHGNFSLNSFLNEFGTIDLLLLWGALFIFGVFLVRKYWKEYLEDNYEENVNLKSSVKR